MGDKATAGLVLGQPQQPAGTAPTILYVYSHWHGKDLPQRVAQGIHDGRARWGEPAYMARILLCAVMADDYAEIDGFGLSHIPYGVPADADRPLLLVDLRQRRAGYLPWAWVGAGRPLPDLEWDYEAFIQVGAHWPQNGSPSSSPLPAS